MSSRLPIHRSINKRLEVLGLGLWELGFLCCLFVGLSESLSFFSGGTALSIGVVVILGGVMRQLNRRFEPRFMVRLIRFVLLPSRLESKMMVHSPSEDIDHRKSGGRLI